MPVAKIIRFDERQSIGGARRKPKQPPQEPSTCVVLRFPRSAALTVVPMGDDDRVAGRGRDPG